MVADLPVVRLKPQADRRLRGGHLWVYSNEIDVTATPLKAFQAGDAVQLLCHNGRPLGSAYINPHSLIAARVISRDGRSLDVSLLRERLRQALELRQRCFDAPFYRLVYGDSDFLPGLVVDRYGDYLAVQLTTAGMECRREQVLEALVF